MRGASLAGPVVHVGGLRRAAQRDGGAGAAHRRGAGRVLRGLHHRRLRHPHRPRWGHVRAAGTSRKGGRRGAERGQ
eukprot:2971052-Pyramimonas_sp.AAC.1